MENTLHTKEMIYILLKHIKLLIAVPLLFALGGYLISAYAIDPEYEATSELLVNQTNNASGEMPATTDVQMNLRLIETYQHIIESVSTRERVSDKLDETYSFADLKKAITVGTNSDSQIITISAQAHSPQTASDIVNTYADVAKKEISGLMDMKNIRIMTKANPARINDPVSPKTTLNTGISFMAGFFLMLIYIAFSAYFNTKIYTEYDVEKYLEMPLIGSFGIIHSSKNIPKSDTQPTDFEKQLSDCHMDKELPESFRHLRTNIQFQKSIKKITSILVTSTNENEGKSVTATNLAIAMAMDHKKTLLIDADLRKSSRKERKQEEATWDQTKGLTTYLSGSGTLDDIIPDPEMSPLNIMPKGPLPPNPTEILSSPRMDRMLGELEDLYDMIIIDSSPMIFPDAAVLATKTDGCVFVNNAGKTKAAHAKKAVSQLKMANATILGAILNNKKKKQKNIIYY
ncbi:chromosome partitioning protein [Lentibacillus kapialis]|uniref:Chromosome partitioning protein n=1 Tax=Lentibacillus kapialis TaxID=340214 RepID=A0A917Q1S9_9BACI|nr:polysaccharide biosynthesis tyrosine autokinase [Lentibacillus kapialis]GGK05755.1 chromosome partitioning protein [Lentibacillus kapialis]